MIDLFCQRVMPRPFFTPPGRKLDFWRKIWIIYESLHRTWKVIHQLHCPLSMLPPGHLDRACQMPLVWLGLARMLIRWFHLFQVLHFNKSFFRLTTASTVWWVMVSAPRDQSGRQCSTHHTINLTIFAPLLIVTDWVNLRLRRLVMKWKFIGKLWVFFFSK